ncbi:MAG: ATP-binding protein [Lewinella sp.]|uniref:ATP-binding protein n=1 Tax=Lewinella sp. TaxID=2004506 RepID=UPI003D6AF839
MTQAPVKYRLLFFLLFSNLILVAQNEHILLLEQMLPQLKSDTALINTWNELSFEYYRLDIQKTIYYSELALEKSRAINFQKGIAQALNYRAIAYDVRGDTQKALENNNASLKIGRNLNDDLLIANALNDIAITYSEINLLEQAMKSYQEALTHYKRTNSEKIIYCLENIGILFINLGEEKKAQEYFDQATDLAFKHKNHNVRFYPFFSKARNFKNLLLLDSAEFYLQLALKEATSLVTRSFLLSDLSFIQLHKSNYSAAQKSSREALLLLEKSGNLDLVLPAANDYASVLLEMKNYQQCIDVLQNYLALHHHYNFFHDLETAYAILSEAKTAQGDYLGANKYLLQQLAIRDSTTQLELNKVIIAQEVKDAIQDKEEENLYLREQQAQNEVISKQSRKVTLAMTTVVGLLISFIILLLFYHRKNKQFNQQLKEQVNAKTQKLQDTNAALKSSNTELERFAYITSHDLREPLRSISGFSTLIQKKLDSSSQNSELIQEYLAYIRTSTSQMDQLIKNILEYSRLEAEAAQTAPIAVKSTLEEVVQSLQYIIKEQNVQLSYAPATMPVVIANPQQLFLVFKNLISNGITYNESESPEINITYKALADAHQFSITDNGIGIEEAFQEQIFDLFKRLHTRQTYEGTGIGLAICRKVVQKMGGTLNVYSAGQGSTFTIKIPTNKRRDNLRKHPK